MKDVVSEMSLFTDLEKEKIYGEFNYYTMNKATDEDKVNQTDPFTEQMLASTQNSMLRNVSTKSVILAPFNSTKSHISEGLHQSIKDMIIDRKNFKFAAKVKEIDRQYE